MYMCIHMRIIRGCEDNYSCTHISIQDVLRRLTQDKHSNNAEVLRHRAQISLS